MNEGGCALNVLEKLEAKALALGSIFDETGDVVRSQDVALAGLRVPAA